MDVDEAEDILVLPVFKSTFHTFTLCKQKPILPLRRPLLVAINNVRLGYIQTWKHYSHA